MEKGKVQKERRKDNIQPVLSQPLNSGWLHLWIVVLHDVMLKRKDLNAVKLTTLPRISPVARALELFSAGEPKF